MKKTHKQDLKTKIYKIKGMHCTSCATMIELDLEDIGIKAECSYSTSTLKINGDHEHKKVIDTLKKSGYRVI